MLRSTGPKQLKYEFVCIERLVPKDHLLRKITKFIDFYFIHDKVKDLYCPDNGRPALDPAGAAASRRCTKKKYCKYSLLMHN